MAIRSGIGGSLGIAPETTYGTFATPTRFVPFDSEGLERDQTFSENKSLRAGRIAQSGDLVRPTTRQAAGPISRPVLTKGEGLWLNQGHGNTVVPTTPVGATDARQQIHEYGEADPFGKSLTLQVGTPDTGGVIRSRTALGAKATSLEWSCEQGGDLMFNVDVDARDLVTSHALAAPTYADGAKTFGMDQMTIVFDEVVYTECVQSFQVSVPIPSKTDRFCQGKIKREPIQNGLLLPVITLEMEFSSLQQWDAFVADTRRQLRMFATSEDEIEEDFFPLFGWTFEETVIKSLGPKVEGEDVIMQTVVLDAVDNGSDPVMVIDTISTDTAL